jgi:hypothetical protein
VLSRYDRMIVQGTLPVFCYADGMTAECSTNNTATSVPQALETPDRFIPDPIHKKPFPSPRAWERFET